MTQPIEAAIAAIAAVVGGVSGIVQAPTYPQEQANYAPFAVTYMTGGNVGGAAVGTKRDLITIAVDVLVPMRNLPEELATLTPLIDLVSYALVAQVSGTGRRFSNTIQAFRDITVTWLPAVDYGGIPHRGYRFAMNNVKLLIDL